MNECLLHLKFTNQLLILPNPSMFNKEIRWSAKISLLRIRHFCDDVTDFFRYWSCGFNGKQKQKIHTQILAASNSLINLLE